MNGELKSEAAQQALDEHLAAVRTNATATDDNQTPYSGTLAEFRAQLCRSSLMWERIQEPYFRRQADEFEKARAEGRKAERMTETEHHAQTASMMASAYCYTLAAILGLAERELGTKAAARLAAVADDILMNGDSDDLNADVTEQPAPPESEAGS